MPRMSFHPAPLLALALVAGAPATAAAPALPAAQLAAIRARQPQLAAQAQAHMAALAGQLNLGAGAGLTARRVSTSPEGRTIVRFQQTHQGLKVWGGEAIAHVEAGGQVKTLTQGLKTAVTVAATTPQLTPDQAIAAALRNLAPKGALKGTPKAELVVFPTRFTSGLATRFDGAKGTLVWDRDMSLPAPRPAEPYRLAYEVRTFLANRQDGHREMCYVVDALTGTLLRKWDDVQRDAPAQGTGQSWFRGQVPLETTQAEDGTFALRSPSRGTVVNPVFAASGYMVPGLATCYGAIDLNLGMLGWDFYKGKAANTWGDGSQMPFPYDFAYVPDPLDWSRWWGGMKLEFSGDGMVAWAEGALSPAGETAAVDCHYGLSTTWDFYKNVFARDGIDDAGTSTFGVVHYIEAGADGLYPMIDNAFWSNGAFGMFFGEGTFGTPWASWSYGLKTLTEVDITAHEMTHGVTYATAGLIYDAQSGGINEATSDIFGKMTQAYAAGGGVGATIPDFAQGDLAAWEVARNCVSQGSMPLRYMYKPSLDGISADGWYDGIDMIDVHFSSGPVNRFFTFLASGASASPSSPVYSPYYPAGLAGIGNDKAARIYYKALTEYMTPDTDFEAARAATVSAAQDLFGAGSAEELAVLKAWSAVNVGLAPGQAPRVKVSFPVIHGSGSFIDDNAQPQGILSKVQFFPTRTDVRIAVNVENAANKAVNYTTPIWTFNGISTAGTIKPDGTWTTPNWNYYEDLLSVRATSQADTSQFAWTWVLLVELDADLDNEVDAIDLGSTAMSWYGPKPFETPLYRSRIAGGGDWDLVFFGEAFSNGYPVK